MTTFLAEQSAGRMTPLRELVHHLNGDYLTARRYIVPLYAALGETRDEETEKISEHVFEMGVNAAYGWYELYDGVDQEKGLREAKALRGDSLERMKAIRDMVARRWSKLRPGEAYIWNGSEPLRSRKRSRTFRVHRQQRPVVLGGQRLRAA